MSRLTSLSILLISTAVLTSYMRWGLGYPICGTDEQNYLEIFDWLDNGGVWPISGPGYAGLILELRHWLGWETRSLVIAVAALNSSVILPLGLWLLYRFSLGSGQSAWRCLPWLFVGSYFLGPWLEGRPQQLGMLLTIFSAWWAYCNLQVYGSFRVGFFLLWLLCFGYHALSFVVLTALVFGFWARRFIQGYSGYKTLATLLLGLTGCLALGALWYPLIWLDIRVNHIRGIQSSGFFGVLVGILGGALLILHCMRRYEIGLRLIRERCVGLPMSLIYGLVVSGVAAALIWQYIWLGHLYEGLNLMKIAWYQGGNILLAALFLSGLQQISRVSMPDLEFFTDSCVVLMVCGGIFLLLTPWLRDHNWTLRIMTYWTWYAAPLAAWGWLHLSERWRWRLLFLSPLLVVGGLGHVLYAPTWNCQVAG